MSAAGNGGCKWAIEALIMSRSDLCLIVHGQDCASWTGRFISNSLSTEMNRIALHSLAQPCLVLNGIVAVEVLLVEVVVIEAVVSAIPEQDNSLIQSEQVAMPACSLPNGIFIANGTNGGHWPYMAG